MSLFIYTQRCTDCGGRWEAQGGVVGTASMDTSKKNCPSCGSDKFFAETLITSTDPQHRTFAWQPQNEGEPWPPASDGFNELLARSKAKEELAAAKAAKQEFDWWHEHFFHDIYVNPNGDPFVSARRKEVEERLAEAVRKMDTL